MARSAVLDFPLAWPTGRALVSACLALSISVPLHAQAYPARSVHLVTAAAAGSASDFVARLLAPQFSASLKAPFIVENRPDAGGTNVLRSAAADGHTLQLASLGSLVIVPAIASAPYDPLEFLAPVAQVASMPNVLTVHPDAGATTLDDLIALAKKEPGRIRYATAGNGMPGIYAGELFKSVAKVDLAFVQPRNGIAALDDLAQGRVNFLIAATPTAVPHVKTGKIRALAVTANRRLQALPDVPTAIENGLASYEATTWYGIVVPAATPRETELWMPVIRRSDGMMPIIAVIRATNSPAFKRPARASRAAIQTIAASANAASICTRDEADALVASIFRFRRRMRLAIRA